MPLEQRHVPKIGFPCEVEDISEDGNRAESGVERHIAGHPDQSGSRGTHAKCFQENPRGENGSSRIADTGNQAEDRIEAESIQHVRELPEPRETRWRRECL